MATRLGIELTSVACRIIEIDTGSGWRRARAARPIVCGSPVFRPEIGARLASYKGRAASVIVWGPYNAHRQVVVTQGTYESMRTDDLAFHRAVDPFGAFHGPAGGVASGRGRLPVRDATGVHSTARLASADPSKTSRDGHAV